MGSAILEQTQAILQGNGDVPQRVTNRMILAVLADLYSQQEEYRGERNLLMSDLRKQNEEQHMIIREDLGRLATDIDGLQTCVNDLETRVQVLDKTGDENITKGYALEKWFLPTLFLILSATIGAFIGAWISSLFGG